MKKVFCDICDNEISGTQGAEVPIEVRGKKYPATIHISIHHREEPRTKDYCLYCLIDQINKLDNRPKPAD